MKLLDDYFDLQRKVHGFFQYIEDWRILPIDDHRFFYWQLSGEGPGTVRYAETKADLLDEDAGNYYEAEVYTQRHLPKWVYRSDGYTMICVDTHTDGNQFLAVFDDRKEIKDT